MSKRQAAKGGASGKGDEPANKQLKTDSEVSTECLSGPEERRKKFEFFDRECADLAKTLLGKKIVRKLDDGNVLEAVIVETEAYLGGDDKAAHSYNGKRTQRNEAMYMKPGTIYVYNIYGMYQCINISSQGAGAAVLIRAVDPMLGMKEMHELRKAKQKSKNKVFKECELGNGPSKLTQALSINKETYNQADIVTCESLWLEDGHDVEEDDIVTTSRVGVDYAGDWAKKQLRFYILGNQSISVRDKKAEGDTNQPTRKKINLLHKYSSQETKKGKK